MPIFVWTAKDKFGNPVVRELSTPTVGQSKQLLLDEGHTDLVLKQDEIMAAMAESFTEKVMVFGEEIQVTATERLKYRDQPGGTLFSILRETTTQDAKLYLIMAALMAWQFYGGRLTIGFILLGVTLIWPGFRVWMGLPGILYRKLNEDREWHRWRDVLALLRRIERIQLYHFIKISRTELIRIRALALAGLNRLPEALTEFQAIRDQPGMPDWLYESNLALIYDCAQQHDQALICTRNSLELDPRNTIYLDLAWRLLHRKKDTSSARAALAKVDATTLIDIAQPFVKRTWGMLAFLEGDDLTAQRELETALTLWERSNARWVFRESNIALTKGYLCCVLARQGELARAKKHFADARNYLTAVRETDLLNRASALLGTPGLK
jgi:hypothetical protein